MWSLIIAIVTVLDCTFTMIFAASFDQWECNPIALRLGVIGSMIARVTTIGFFLSIVQFAPERFRLWCLRYVGVIHLALGVWLVLALP